MIKQLSTKTVYQNKWMKVREDKVRFANGHEGIYGVVEKPDFSLVIPFERGGFYLVKQFRYPVNGSFWEFPQGSCEQATNPLECARQELKEETGLSSHQFQKIGFLYEANGYCNQGFHVFLAESFSHGEQELETTEQGMLCQWFSLEDFGAMLDRGEIRDAPTVAAFGLFLRKSGNQSPPHSSNATL